MRLSEGDVGKWVEDRDAEKELGSCRGSCKYLTLFSFPCGPLGLVVSEAL